MSAPLRIWLPAVAALLAVGTARAKPPVPLKPAAPAAKPAPAKPGTPAGPADAKAAPAKPAPPPWAGKALGAVTALAFSPDGKRLAVGTYGQVALYDTATWQQAGLMRGAADNVRALAFSPDGQTLAIGCGLPGESGIAMLWNPAGSGAARKLPNQADTIEALAFSKDGKQLLLGADDNKARLYDSLPDTAKAASLDEHNDRVQGVAISPKPDYLFATCGLDKIVKIWDAKTRHVVVNFDQGEDGITGVAFLPNGDQLVGSCLDGRLYWWGTYFDNKQKAFGGYHYRRNDAHDGPIYTLGQSGDLRRIITGGADHMVKVWDIDNGGQIKAFKDAAEPIYAAALNKDGKVAAAGGREGVVRVYDVEGDKLLATLVPPALPAPPRPVAPVRKTATVSKLLAHGKR